MKLNNMQRSRLKLTLFGAILLSVVLLFPIYIIYKASEIAVFELNAVWVAFGTTVTTIGAILGYYINKESQRPSLMNTNIITPTIKKIMNGEDESDPEDIPL